LTRVLFSPLYHQPPATQAGPRYDHFPLRRGKSIRQVLWVGRRLVLVEQNRLRAYTLP
jgi:hypothetical protein